MTTSVGASNPASFTYLATPPPNILGVNPTTGPQVGGTVVVIKGSNFDQVFEVLVDQVSVPFTVLSTKPKLHAVSFISPPHAPGVVLVVVTTSAGSSNAATFTYDATPPQAFGGLSAAELATRRRDGAAILLGVLAAWHLPLFWTRDIEECTGTIQTTRGDMHRL